MDNNIEFDENDNSMNIEFQYIEAGSIYLPGKVVVGDFWVETTNPWCLTLPVREGSYDCIVGYYMDEKLGKIISSLTIIHEDVETLEVATDTKTGMIAVDCSVGGFFVNKPTFANDDDGVAYIESLDMAGLKQNKYVLTENEFLSHSGLGDDMYTATAYELDGQIFAVDIDFFN